MCRDGADHRSEEFGLNDAVKIADEEPGQEAAIRAVVADAFGRAQEARLVDELRADGELAVSLVAIEAGILALSRMRSPARALGLAPLSVRTIDQRRGIGARLVQEAIARARRRHYEIIFVLGDPGYYSRFGFSTAAAAGFTSRYAGAHFMALHLDHAAAPVGAGAAIYADPLEHWSEPTTNEASEGTAR
jgi:putative acetyltransferase